MMKRIIALILILNVSACAELQQVVNQLPQGGLGNAEIASGLRQALDFGIDKQVTKLTQKDGFFKNELVMYLQALLSLVGFKSLLNLASGLYYDLRPAVEQLLSAHIRTTILFCAVP